MVQGYEKRTCHRFEIPGGKISYRRKKLFGFSEYYEAHQLINISKGGASFDCGEEFKEGQRIIIKIMAPDEPPLELYADVRWQRESGDFKTAVGVIFAPFGHGFNLNPVTSLDALRRLDAKYVKDHS